MAKYPYNDDQVKVVGEERSFRGSIPVYNYPCSRKEAMKATYIDKDPIWLLTGGEGTFFCPSVIPDDIARGFVFEGRPWPEKYTTYKDMFGVEWVYVDQVGGAMVKPGAPLMEDVNEWKEKVIIPDIDSWDWEGSAAMNKEYLANSDKAITLWYLNGCWFERMISFMDFENAAMALLDEDQEDALHEMLHELTSLYIRITDKAVQYYNIDGICIHDDWGSQMAPFFSDDAAREFFLPEMKRFVDHVHSLGLYCDLHSCGHIESRIDVFVEAGFDSWTPMAMNNTAELYEKYGDKICISVVNDSPIDPTTASEEEVRQAARDYVAKYCKPGKPSQYSMYSNPAWMGRPEFMEELYKASRKVYGA
ncbi:MAG: methyltransferase [Eubacterium sp.]|nr:methyltransferase [Eubacterium sp.]